MLIFLYMGLMGANAQSNKYDLNEDGDVNVTDVTLLVSKILAQNEESGYDLNNDGDVNITDVIMMVNYILGNNQEMPSLQLSTNSIYINGDYLSNQRLVQIISGSGSYTVTSSNNYVATAEIYPESYVTLTIKGLGETTITVHDEVSGKTATIHVVVMTLPQRPEDGGILLAVGQQKTIEFTFDNPEDYEIEITDPSIATVEKNNNLIVVKGISEGYTHLWVSDTKNGTLVRHFYVRVYLYCPDDNHPHMIDLGLPSGTKWACCNVGATIPEGYGGYYAWGETEGKDLYSNTNYQFDKYSLQNLGNDIASTQYDVAHMKWGGNWRMPSEDDFHELVDNCRYNVTEKDGVEGGLFISGINGCRIFLPMAGNGYDDKIGYGISAYWSSTQMERGEGYSYPIRLAVYNSNPNIQTGSFWRGHSVRPVWKE